MKTWSEIKEQIKKVSQDKEIARSFSKTVKIRLEALDVLLKKDVTKFASMLAEGYYEVIKELIIGIMAIDGFKTVSHEALIIYLQKFYKEFENYEINFIDDLRKIRNKIDYKGFSINPDYIKRNKLEILHLVSKLRKLLKKKLE